MSEKYPQFEKGKKLRSIKAVEWQTLSDSAKVFDNLRVSPPLRLKRDQQGAHISIDLPDVQRVSGGVVTATRTVLVTAEPTSLDTELVVRSVKYKDEPPAQGEYDWDGEEFVAYPDFGFKCVDYLPLVKASGLPVLEDKYTQARMVGKYWIVAGLAESVSAFAVIVDSFPANTPGSRFLTVQEVDLKENGGYGVVEGSSPRNDVLCWPNMKASDYLVLKSMIPANVVELKLINGKVYARHDFRARIVKPNTGYGASDCPV